MPYVHGFLRMGRRNGLGHPDQGLPDGEIEVDPGYGIEEGGHPDQGLPPLSHLRPDNGLPKPPPGVFPPLTPSHPIQPTPPGTPPGAIWPPIYGGGHPDQGLPGAPPHPDQGLPPGSPGAPDQGLPPSGGRPVHPDQGLPSKTFWVVAGIPGVGWRYICVDPSLVVGYPLPPMPQPK